MENKIMAFAMLKPSKDVCRKKNLLILNEQLFQRHLMYSPFYSKKSTDVQYFFYRQETWWAPPWITWVPWSVCHMAVANRTWSTSCPTSTCCDTSELSTSRHLSWTTRPRDTCEQVYPSCVAVCVLLKFHLQLSGKMKLIAIIRLEQTGNLKYISKTEKKTKNTYTEHEAMADPRGRQGRASSGSKFFHIHAVFSKNLQNNRLAHPLWELAPLPPRKSWIRHCLGS